MSQHEPSARLVNLVGAMALGLADCVKNAALLKIELSQETAAALVVIGHSPGLSILQLGKVLRLSHPGTVRLVDRLSEANLVKRTVSKLDRRAVALNLTRTGHAQRKQLLSRRQQVLADKLQVLSPADQAALERITETILKKLPEDATSALAVCRFCNENKCEPCPMDQFGSISDK